MQVADIIINNIEAPAWVFSVILLMLSVGFPLTVLFAWAFELTPEGVKKARDVDPEASVTASTGQKINYVIIGLLVIALGYFVWERQQATAPTETMLKEGKGGDAGAITAPAETSIAVLPFADMSAEGDQEYFSDGISEELLNVLMRVEGLQVASRTSSFVFKGQSQNVSQIADELGVDHILEGSIRKSGNRIRITAQLIDAGTDRHLWSETYDRELVDIFAIQDEIANAIVIALKGALGVNVAVPGFKAVSVTAATENISAYDSYLKARALFITRTDMADSVQMFEQAVALDPNFARAWEGLAAVLAVMPGWGFRDRDYYAESETAAHRAIEIEPDLSLAYAVLASNATLEDPIVWDTSFGYFERAISNDPTNATARLWRGIALASLGYLDQAMADYAACVVIDPAYQNCYAHQAAIHSLKGEHEASLPILINVRLAGYLGGEPSELNTMIKSGQRLAAVQWAISWYDEPNAPIKEWIEAIEDPSGDTTLAIAKWDAWLASEDQRLDDRLEMLLALRAYDRINASNYVDVLEVIWISDYSEFRKTPHFKRLVGDFGMVDYWHANGFPPQCRSLGDDDFECD
jgi:adenylate cyclase